MSHRQVIGDGARTRTIYETQSLPRCVVHQIQYGTTAATAAKVLLQEGANIVEQVRDGRIWHSVKVKVGYDSMKNASSRFLTISAPPPDIKFSQSARVADTVRNWAEPPTAEEIFALDDLEEFESTDLSNLFHKNDARSQGTKRPTPLNPEYSEPLNQDEPHKKFLRLDNGSLHRIIPQPHTKLSKSLIPPDFNVIKAYDRTLPIYLHPHLSSTNDDNFGRRAWIIPARGFLPSAWTEAGASSAVVLDTQHPDLSHSLDRITIGPTIKWSHLALAEFWKYLNTLRDLNNLGSLGISFHPAQSASVRLEREKEKLALLDSSEMQPGLHPPYTTLPLSSVIVNLQSGQSSITSGTRPLSLRDCDYFKVYHDSNISMHLRRALDLFTFRLDSEEEEQSEQSGEFGMTFPESSNSSGLTGKEEGGSMRRKKPKYCLLRGARLVLVDDRSKGVLIA
ncbi:hypothetical protein F5890DRAFT_1534938 [Lentinula detonsa]|uniref:Uncharacterized protein n=1 Tax=Lentinula detonsa TaxID=2804962 RepID=A0AA38URM5_9AGAR|nr:hypothetical protein F5890DRAFT_1534938 [Lentinula detonsa]